ncbi:MAG TPA: ABC transporter ATP-binding protein [Xanthobacteraceae bacterium]|nr:ABC transporter ATP-binding protein [Xanthobacteraceae bacterium]
MTALLSVENVTAGYIADIDILRGVTVAVPAATITGLIGLNGAGKSTIMKTICGFLVPKSGTIRFDGADITGIAPHTAIDRGIFYVPQESSLFPHMTVENNLRLPLEHLARRPGGPSREEIARRVEETFDTFAALRARRAEKAGALSGGQQKMVEFAKAYLVRPRLCLVDEPAIGLAPKIAEQVYEWIDLIARERAAILLVDHNVRRVVRMASYTYVLSLGQITAEGRREDFEGNLHEQVRAWLGITF